MTAVGRRCVWVIGDSWTDRYYDAGSTPMWPQLVAEALDVDVHNAGVGGSGYAKPGVGYLPAGGTGSKQATFTSEVVDNPAGGADAVVVFGSINDWWAGYTPAHLAGQARVLLRLLERYAPGAPILVTGPQWHDPNTEPWGDLLAQRDALRAETLRVGARWVDASGWMRGVPGVIDPATQHPNAAGQRWLAAAMTPLVEQLLAVRAMLTAPEQVVVGAEHGMTFPLAFDAAVEPDPGP